MVVEKIKGTALSRVCLRVGSPIESWRFAKKSERRRAVSRSNARIFQKSLAAYIRTYEFSTLGTPIRASARPTARLKTMPLAKALAFLDVSTSAASR